MSRSGVHVRAATPDDLDVVVALAGNVREAGPVRGRAAGRRGLDGVRDRCARMLRDPAHRVVLAVDDATGEVEVIDEGAAPAPERTALTAAPSLRAMPAIELVLRVLAEARPGRPLRDEATRVAARHVVVPHPMDGAELRQLEQLGVELSGPSFSVAELLEAAHDRQRPGHGNLRGRRLFGAQDPRRK